MQTSLVAKKRHQDSTLAVQSIAQACSAWLAIGLMAPPAQAQTSVTLTLRNGDSIQGVKVAAESDETTIVLIHPDLGRLKIPRSALKPKRITPWSGSLAAGVNASNTDSDLSAGGNITATAQYKQPPNLWQLKGQAQYAISQDKGDQGRSIDTNQGSADVRYSRSLNNTTSLYASSTLNYNALNIVGTQTLTSSVGLGFDIIKTPTTTLNLSIGPALQQIWGGNGCNNDPNCGIAYPASTARGALEWSPNKSVKFNISNQFTGSYVNGFSPSNILSGSIKIFPLTNKNLFLTLNGQTIYNTLQEPNIDNSVSFQIGTELKQAEK